MNENLEFLNDFVHVNFDHVLSRITRVSVEPVFYESTIIHVVELVKIVEANCAWHHIELFGIASTNELKRVMNEVGQEIL